MRRLAPFAAALGCVVGICVTPEASGPQAARAADVDLIARAETAIAEALADHNVPGAAFSLVRDGKVLLSRGFGIASTADNSPVTAETVFRAGSISKALTAAALVGLVDAGRIQLDDDVSRYLTQVRVPDRFGEPWRPQVLGIALACHRIADVP